MPYYLFQSPNNQQIKEIFFHMNDEKSYEEDGVKWQRIFTKPTAAADTKLDIRDPKSFVNYTGKRKGSIGDLFDVSKEASIKRKEKDGVDPIQNQYYENYKKKRAGRVEHQDIRKKKLKEDLSKSGVQIEF